MIRGTQQSLPMNGRQISVRMNKADRQLRQYDTEFERAVIRLINARETSHFDTFAPYYEHVARQTALKFKELFTAEEQQGGRCTYAFDYDDSRQVNVLQTITDGLLLQFGGQGCSCPVEICCGENGLNIKFRHGHRLCYVLGYKPGWKTSIVEAYIEEKYDMWKAWCQTCFRMIEIPTLMQPATGTHGDTCTICQEELSSESEDIVTPIACGHVFHRQCLSGWWESKKLNEFYKCPNCNAICESWGVPYLPNSLKHWQF